jgi:hypothetical protein
MKHMSIGSFAEHILEKPLYPYQIEAGNAILESVLSGAGRTITCLCARQTGKNQLSAVLEAYILFAMESGTMVKCAPTWKPQAVNSRMRLLSMLEAPLTRDRVWRSFGYIIGLAPTPEQVKAQTGPKLLLFSAGPESNIVGATASLLLEVDEAQDIALEKYDVQLRPMASTTNATTVMYGTAWSDDTLLARQKVHNLDLEQRDGIRRHFEYDWRVLAAINPQYKKFVEAEIERLGYDHVSIRTQFRLLPIEGAGFLFNELQRHLLQGTHQWQDEPDEQGEGYYIAGLDIGGEERCKRGEEAQGNVKRDSTILTIGRVYYNELDLPKIEVVHQCWWTGMRYLDQYAAISEFMQRWNIRKVVIDKTGLGDGLSSLLLERCGAERIGVYQFTRPSKSKLTFQFLGMVNSGRIRMYSPQEAPTAIYEECWKQLRLARYSIPGEGLMSMYCHASESHDDFLISLALCCEAVREFYTPVQESLIVRPRRLYEDGGY